MKKCQNFKNQPTISLYSTASHQTLAPAEKISKVKGFVVQTRIQVGSAAQASTPEEKECPPWICG